MRNMAAALLLSHGVPMVQMGDEYGHTKVASVSACLDTHDLCLCTQAAASLCSLAVPCVLTSRHKYQESQILSLIIHFPSTLTPSPSPAVNA